MFNSNRREFVQIIHALCSHKQLFKAETILFTGRFSLFWIPVLVLLASTQSNKKKGK